MRFKDNFEAPNGWKDNLAFLESLDVNGITRMDNETCAGGDVAGREFKLSYFQLSDVFQQSKEWLHFVSLFPKCFHNLDRLNSEVFDEVFDANEARKMKVMDV
jgi:hypothetical protein